MISNLIISIILTFCFLSNQILQGNPKAIFNPKKRKIVNKSLSLFVPLSELVDILKNFTPWPLIYSISPKSRLKFGIRLDLASVL